MSFAVVESLVEMYPLARRFSMLLKSFSHVSALVLLFIGLASCTGAGDSGGASSDRIVRVSRQNNSGTYHYFREVVIGETGEFKLGSIDQSGSKDVVALVAKTPLAIGYSGMAYATPDVKMLKISKGKGEPGVAPTVENAQNGTYPITRPLFIYTREEPKGAIKEYIDWILSEEGQKIVADIGYVPVEPTGPPKEGSNPEASIKVSGSDTMVNLAQAWAAAYNMKHSNVKVQVSGGGSGVGIRGLIDGTVDLADASRKMRPTEVARATEKNGVEPQEFIVGHDALAVYVHKDNPVSEVTLEDLKGIYGEGGTIERWSQIAKPSP
jgi:ABC-type phosphate transport system substrate-binding protein